MLCMQWFRLINGEHFHDPIISSGPQPLLLSSLSRMRSCRPFAMPAECAAGVVSADCLYAMVNTGEQQESKGMSVQSHDLCDHAEFA